MPIGPIIGTGDEVWVKGYLFGTSTGDAQADSRPLGEMQDFSLKDSLATKTVNGVGSLGAVAVGIASRTVTGSAKWLKVRMRQMQMLRGSAPVYSSTPNTTKWSAGINDEPLPFNLHFMGGSLQTPDTELLVHRAISPELTIPLAQRDFAIPDITFDVFGDGFYFYEFVRPGDHTTS